MKETRKGMLLVISGPSGAGKGTLVNLLREDDPSFEFSVSAATRKPRDYEKDGEHYHFISEETFDQLILEDAFIEYATVHDHRYGTLKSEVYQRLENGENVILDIDTQGALNVMAREPECVSVFVLPPSWSELRNRLRTRNTEDPEEIEKRWQNAHGEVQKMDRYQYVIVNHYPPEESYKVLKSIVEAEKQRTNRYHPVIED